MKDSLIRKEDAIKALGEEPMVWTDSDFELADRNRWQMDVEALKKLSPVQPKRGKWITEPIEDPEYCRCSECGYANLVVEVFSFDGYNYCPNCGARME